MKRALIRSCNLLGDALWIGPVMKRWMETKGKDFDEIHLVTCPNHAVDIYKAMGIPWKVMFEPEYESYDYEFKFDAWKAYTLSTKKLLHMARMFGEMMDVDMTGVPLVPNYQPPEMEVEEDLKNRVLLSMFSFSNPENKVPRKWEDWNILLDTLRREYPDSKFGMLGGLTERPPDVLGIKEDEYLLGMPMDKTANVMKYAKCVVTVDNGMAHLAGSQKANQFYLAAWCLHLHYIVPWGNPNLRLWHFDPQTADMSLVNECLKSAIKDWKCQAATNG